MRFIDFFVIEKSIFFLLKIIKQIVFQFKIDKLREIYKIDIQKSTINRHLTNTRSENPRADAFLHNNNAHLRRIISGEARPKLANFMFGHHGKLSLRDTISKHEYLLGQKTIHLVVLLQSAHESRFKCVGELLTDHLKAHFRVPSSLVLIETRHEARYGLVAFLDLMVHVYSYDHDFLHWYGQAPQFAAQFHVHLQNDLLRDRSKRLIWFIYRFGHDNL